MSRFLDARVPVRFAQPDQAGPDTAWLVQDDAPTPVGVPPDALVARFRQPDIQPGHPVTCTCCVPRGPVADTLSRLFLARARGEVAFFRAVIAIPRDAAGAGAIKTAIATDPMLQARFRLAD